MILALCLFGAAILTNPARAGVLTFTTEADYMAATTGSTTYTFAGGSTGGTSVAPSYTNGPLTFAATTLKLFNDGSYGTGVTYLAGQGGFETVTLSGATALSFTLGTYFGTRTIAINVNGTAVTTVTETGGHPTTMFVGFTSTTPITSLTFTDTTVGLSKEVDTTGFQVGTAVPEPSTRALIYGGAATLSLFGLVTLISRRQRLEGHPLRNAAA